MTHGLDSFLHNYEPLKKVNFDRKKTQVTCLVMPFLHKSDKSYISTNIFIAYFQAGTEFYDKRISFFWIPYNKALNI